mmetsp:Transcript_12109/g.26241  ORF Transcript_12109/g.26241 Transcript_12109/m.26241 type:complete len:285 (-) Transcript_12109:1232-2086(-)
MAVDPAPSRTPVSQHGELFLLLLVGRRHLLHLGLDLLQFLQHAFGLLPGGDGLGLDPRRLLLRLGLLQLGLGDGSLLAGGGQLAFLDLALPFGRGEVLLLLLLVALHGAEVGLELLLELLLLVGLFLGRVALGGSRGLLFLELPHGGLQLGLPLGLLVHSRRQRLPGHSVRALRHDTGHDGARGGVGGLGLHVALEPVTVLVQLILSFLIEERVCVVFGNRRSGVGCSIIFLFGSMLGRPFRMLFLLVRLNGIIGGRRPVFGRFYGGLDLSERSFETEPLLQLL